MKVIRTRQDYSSYRNNFAATANSKNQTKGLNIQQSSDNPDWVARKPEIADSTHNPRKQTNLNTFISANKNV